MQKKLYFLDEQEKNRILNLHESRTQGQYLLNEAIDRKTFTKKVDDICAAGTYGRGNFTDEKIKKDAEVMTRNFTGGRKSNEGLRTIADNIRKLNSIGNYCRVAKKYKELGGLGSSLTDWARTFVYMDNAWELYIKQPLEELIKNSEAIKQKSDAGYMINPTDSTVTTTDQTVQQVVQQPATQQQGYQQVAGGYVLNPFTTEVVNNLRTAVGITGQGGVNQADINQLYAKISALPNKTA